MNEHLRLTYEQALAKAAMAGTRSMRAGKREQWNQEDYHAACEEFALVWPGEAEEKTGETEETP